MNTNEENLAQATSDTDLSYCRAAIYSVLSLGFQPPTEQILSRLLTPESRASLAHAATLLYPEQKTDLVISIEALAQAGENDTAALASRYHFLFGHTARGE